ncbi:MAG TPA: fumarylacetoacetate hydrolase family protein [Caulobacteraceae bacterium]
MFDTVISALAPPSIPVADDRRVFPVRRILCVGRNYAAHRREMGGDDRDPPFFFAKPADAVVTRGEAVTYPQATSDLHHEVELVVALGAAGADIPPAQALTLVFGYAVGVDLTRRDLQGAARAKALPWEAAKAFDNSAPVSALRRAADGPPQGRIGLRVNGTIRQDARITDMIWSVPEIISEASKLWRLAPGDLIFTGTPEGVGPLLPGDRVEAFIEGLETLTFAVV